MIVDNKQVIRLSCQPAGSRVPTGYGVYHPRRQERWRKVTQDRKQEDIELFLQGEGIEETKLIHISSESTILAVLEQAKKNGSPSDGDLLVFIEDGEEPLPVDQPIKAAGFRHHGRIQAHRCRQITVTVNFNGAEKSHRFPPSTTVARVKKWAVGEHGYNLKPVDAAEHVLQLCGSNKRPDDDIHIGSLTTSPTCSICFDLVPKVRIEG